MLKYLQEEFFKFIFNWRIIAYNVVLVSAIQQCESALSVPMSPPSWISLPPSTPSRLSRPSQRTRVISALYSNFPWVIYFARGSGRGHGNPLQYSCLGNPMDRGAWRATVHGAIKSWTQLKQLSTALHMAACMFPHCSLGLSRPLLPAPCPQVCSLHLRPAIGSSVPFF